MENRTVGAEILCPTCNRNRPPCRCRKADDRTWDCADYIKALVVGPGVMECLDRTQR